LRVKIYDRIEPIFTGLVGLLSFGPRCEEGTRSQSPHPVAQSAARMGPP